MFLKEKKIDKRSQNRRRGNWLTAHLSTYTALGEDLWSTALGHWDSGLSQTRLTGKKSHLQVVLSIHWCSFCCIHDAWYEFPDVANSPPLIDWNCAYLEETNSLRCFLYHTWGPPSYLFILLTRPQSPEKSSFSHLKVSLCFLGFLGEFRQMCKSPLHNCKSSFL